MTAQHLHWITLETCVEAIQQQVSMQRRTIEQQNNNSSNPNALFEVNPDCSKIDTKKAEMFPTWTPKRSFACERPKSNDSLIIAILCVQVKSLSKKLPFDSNTTKLKFKLFELYC